MAQKTIEVILDGDLRYDTSVAWGLAQLSSELEIRAITTVAGAYSSAQVTEYAEKLAKIYHITAPLAQGGSQPLLAKLIVDKDAENTGLESLAAASKVRADAASMSSFSNDEQQSPNLSPLSAVTLMAETLKKAKKPMTVIATGPLTNIATLLLIYPELKSQIEQFVILGGALKRNNATAAAEYNFYEDYEAAALVFSAQIPIIWLPIDIKDQSLLTAEELKSFQQLKSPLQPIFDFYADKLALPASCALSVLLRPEIFQARLAEVEIETAAKYCLGNSIACFGAEDEECTLAELSLDKLKIARKENEVRTVLAVKRTELVALLRHICEANI